MFGDVTSENYQSRSRMNNGEAHVKRRWYKNVNKCFYIFRYTTSCSRFGNYILFYRKMYLPIIIFSFVRFNDFSLTTNVHFSKTKTLYLLFRLCLLFSKYTHVLYTTFFFVPTFSVLKLKSVSRNKKSERIACSRLRLLRIYWNTGYFIVYNIIIFSYKTCI